ncbi:hypothetical protein BCR35DRAFT_224482 [Leucosporidium creatinivorum]|uniref:Uncharacterized protein n=1 Tax=Leucosporidium creatinivorum TaxID=106004 RepID=A0A1Y2D6F8_9BASI|nr:hypothetical protein BCR35DRAFT_224482 [Leucosporidium creatinivorum]
MHGSEMGGGGAIPRSASRRSTLMGGSQMGDDVLPNLPRSTSTTPLPSAPHPSFANPQSYPHNPQQTSYNAPTPRSFSPAPPSAIKRRFASSSNLSSLAAGRGSLKRGAVDEGRSGKRSRLADEEEEEEEGMELDQRLVEVREMRRRYKMPQDSLHPDAKLMHEVLVERWLTDAEYDQLLKQRKLGWQVSEEAELAAQAAKAKEAEGEGEVKMEVEVDEEVSRLSFYFAGE